MRSCALLLLLVATATSCRPKEGGYFGTTDRSGRDAQTFYLNNFTEPESLDPGLTSDSTSSTLLHDLFEGLVVKHPQDLRPTQGVATHWDQSEDNRVFRFHLRPEARWSDGRPVVAGDFHYAWTRVLEPETAARMVTMLYVIKNGKLFHTGKLKVLKQPEKLADVAGGTGKQLAQGTALRLLKAAAGKSAFKPRETADGVTQVAFEPGDAKKTTPPVLRYQKGQQNDATPSAADNPYVVAVLERGDKVECNRTADHWYRVRVAGQEGWLPGCAIADDPQSPHQMVAVHHDLPTFAPTKRDLSTLPVEVGFVPTPSLVRDANVLGVRATNAQTLDVELEQPISYFIELCTYPALFPVRQDVLERFAAAGEPDKWWREGNMVNNGPYVIKDWRFQYDITFAPNPHWYDKDKLKLKNIKWLAVTEYSQVLNLYEAGEIDWVGGNASLPSHVLRDVLPKYKDFGNALWLASYWYEFNVEKPPVNDARVRRALNLAVNKQLLVDNITRGEQMPAWHYVPPYTGSGYSEVHQADIKAGKNPFAGPEFRFNPERARELLKEAGYNVVKQGDGFKAEDFPALEILYNTSEGHRQIAVAIQDMWKRHLGISVALRNEEWKVMLKNIRDGHFQIARFGWIADYNHPHTYADLLYSFSYANHTNWTSAAYDKLVEQAAATAEPLESMRLYRDAELLALQSMPRLPLYFYTKSTLIKPYVKGYWPNASNDHFVRWMWIDDDYDKGGANAPSYPPREFPKPGRLAPVRLAPDRGVP